MLYKSTKQEEISKLDILLKWLVDIVIVISAGLFIAVFWGERVTITGYSMEPTLTHGEVVLIDRLSYHFKDPERFDIVAISPREETGYYSIKRIIGLPGETIVIKNGIISINGEVMGEAEHILSGGLAEKGILLGEDEYFLLGDNYNNSEDSRFATVGNVKKDTIIGRVWFRVTNLDKIGFIE